ncbi:hypothetical protein, conserved [Leishmania tarentolae]|uniref:SMP-LTD domain-containing protein n=1 Tax=Leishmania tarentolae TaxID=5689 RepID=A0A640KGH1_LEITA|nr:hypothetical protein, conserved [Leishmania tarentolae]
MGILTALAFVYGVVGGATSVLIFFIIVFRKTEKLLADTVRKKVRKHTEFDAVAKEAAKVPPAKVETLCKMVRFDNGILGDSIQCRMVFYGKTIDVYQVDKLRTLANHRQEVVSEHMLGRINRACIVATSQRISKYHRHRNQSSRYAAIKGKCTILNHKDGMPLFLEDPTALLEERLRCIKERQEQEAMRKGQAHQSQRDMNTMTAKELAVQTMQLQCEGYSERCGHGNTATNSVDCQHDLMGTATAAARGNGALRSSMSHWGCGVFIYTKGRHGEDLLPEIAQEVPLSKWTCVAIKFPTRRVQERWLNLLQSTPESAQWHEFITHLPQMDVFNLLIARLFFENSRANTLHDLLEEKLKRKLARLSKSLPPKLRGNIFLDMLDVGGEIPLISNVSDPVPSTCGDTEFDFDMLYRGGLALKIRFSVLYRDIRVPDIIFSIKVLELAGRMRFVVGPPPTRKFWLGGPHPPQLRLEFTQEVASHDGILNAVLRLLPDMSKIASNIVKVMLFEDMVLPNMDDFPWPMFGDDSDDDRDSTTAYSDVAGPTNPRNGRGALLESARRTVEAGGNTEKWDSSSKSSSGVAVRESHGIQNSTTRRRCMMGQSVYWSDDTLPLKPSAEDLCVTSSVPCTPPLRPVLQSASAPEISVPQRHSSRCSTFDSNQDSSTQSLPRSPPLHLSQRAHPASAIRAPPRGLPPRAPPVQSSESLSGTVASGPATSALKFLETPTSAEPN